MLELHRDIAHARFCMIVATSKEERDAAYQDLKRLRAFLSVRLNVRKDARERLRVIVNEQLA